MDSVGHPRVSVAKGDVPQARDPVKAAGAIRISDGGAMSTNRRGRGRKAAWWYEELGGCGHGELLLVVDRSGHRR